MLANWSKKLEEKGLAAPEPREEGLQMYWRKNNLNSIDGLPAMEIGPDCQTVPKVGAWVVNNKNVPVPKMNAEREWVRLLVAFVLGVVLATMVATFKGSVYAYYVETVNGL